MAASKAPAAATLGEVIEEVERARAAHPDWHSTHHGYAVILEELDELWDEVRKKPTMRDKQQMRREACQIAATAIRFMEELT